MEPLTLVYTVDTVVMNECIGSNCVDFVGLDGDQMPSADITAGR